MIKILQLLITGVVSMMTNCVQAQGINKMTMDSVTRMLRFFEDDDYINFWGCGTDNSYTSGSRLDYYYQPNQKPHGLLGRWGLKAGTASVDTYSWGLEELIYTPNDIARTEWEPHDYQYAGAFAITHSKYSYNPEEKYAFQTEVVVGVIGPSALAGPIQTTFHQLIQYTTPKGWRHQYQNDILINLNITAEKQFVAECDWLTIIGGVQLYGGTMQNGAAVYPLFIVGHKASYFDGPFSQYLGTGKIKGQLYFICKPELQVYAQNAMLEGGLFTQNPNYTGKVPSLTHMSTEKVPDLQHWVSSFTYGFVYTQGIWGISITENVSSATLHNLYCHDFGNVSLYVGL